MWQACQLFLHAVPAIKMQSMEILTKEEEVYPVLYVIMKSYQLEQFVYI